MCLVVGARFVAPTRGVPAALAAHGEPATCNLLHGRALISKQNYVHRYPPWPPHAFCICALPHGRVTDNPFQWPPQVEPAAMLHRVGACRCVCSQRRNAGNAVCLALSACRQRRNTPKLTFGAMNHFDRTARCSAPCAKSTRTPPCSGNSTDPLCRCASVRTLPVPAVAAAAVPVARDPPLIPSPGTALRDVLCSVFPCFPPQASQRQPVQGKQPIQPAPASVHEPRSGWCVARGGGASGFATALRSLTLLPRDLIPPRRRPRAQEPRHGRARQCTCHRGGRWCRHAAGCGHRQCGVRQQPAAPPHGGSATHPRLPCRRSYHGATAGSPWAPGAATHRGRGWWRRRW